MNPTNSTWIQRIWLIRWPIKTIPSNNFLNHSSNKYETASQSYRIPSNRYMSHYWFCISPSTYWSNWTNPMEYRDGKSMKCKVAKCRIKIKICQQQLCSHPTDMFTIYFPSCVMKTQKVVHLFWKFRKGPLIEERRKTLDLQYSRFGKRVWLGLWEDTYGFRKYKLI